MEEQIPNKESQPSPPPKRKPAAKKKPDNKYKPQVKIRPTIAASRVGQPTAQRVTGARVNSVRVKRN